MAKIVNREEQLKNSLDDLISFPTDHDDDNERQNALGRDLESKDRK
ncbi:MULTISPECIES: hypothetical protein [Leuconostoc]|nr:MULTISPECIES: hypothetical protein [Leuconostoc]MBB6431908.1 hypothetical protein [Leuconostoc carnosum]MDV8935677.1 hypothetical protein [Leuconostoc sp.]WLC59554.1 hypothetical protein HTZ88_05995 [Leuconostoc carnosum]WLC97278.1 hypothetical protein Q5R05_06300 [Leuconostoc carnosum]SPJ43143.1 conserved hypothetical protein [Leuconostoc carnosum]